MSTNAANSQQPTANSQRPTTNSQQPTANCHLPTANSQKPAASSQRPTANGQLPTANRQHLTASSQKANCQLPTANCQHPRAKSHLPMSPCPRVPDARNRPLCVGYEGRSSGPAAKKKPDKGAGLSLVRRIRQLFDRAILGAPGPIYAGLLLAQQSMRGHNSPPTGPCRKIAGRTVRPQRLRLRILPTQPPN